MLAIDINKIVVNYDEYPVLNDISLAINEKEFVGIVGPNGGGKTTLLKSIIGLIEPTSGEIKIFGKEIKKEYDDIRYVPQHSELNRNFPITVREVVMQGKFSSGLHPFHFHNKNCKESAKKIEDNLNIGHLYSRSIDALSGGEFQRLLIARALISEPKILILDEPTSNVDYSSKEIIFEYLKKMANEKTIVMVSHDLNFLIKYASRIIVIDKTIEYDGNPKRSALDLEAFISKTGYIKKGDELNV